MLGEVWESVGGCGGYEKIWGEVWESVLRCREVKGEMWGEMKGVWGSVLGVWGEV